MLEAILTLFGVMAIAYAIPLWLLLKMDKERPND
jgi:hypothetical protein